MSKKRGGNFGEPTITSISGQCPHFTLLYKGQMMICLTRKSILLKLRETNHAEAVIVVTA